MGRYARKSWALLAFHGWEPIADLYSAASRRMESRSMNILERRRDQIDLFVDLSPEGELDVRSGVNKYSYNGNWKLQIENAIDGYHPNLVHQSTFEVIQKRIKTSMDVFNGNSIGETRDLGNGHVMLDFRRYNRAAARGPRVLPTISGRGAGVLSMR